MSSEIIQARVENIIPLTDTILQVILSPISYVPYRAGQYLKVLLAQEELSFSIANAPLGAGKYELHIRHTQGNTSAQQLLHEIRQQELLTIQLPFGDCNLEQLQKNQPILFIASGTGFAPIKAMIEQLLASSDSRSFELFWGARSQSDLYMDEKVLQWQAHVERFRYFSLVYTVNREMLINKVLEQHVNDLKNWQIVIGGPFDMVYVIRDYLIEVGLSREQLYADAFSFEK